MSHTIWLPPTASDEATSVDMRVRIFLPLKAVFEDCNSTVEELRVQLAKLSRTDALIWCARLNLVVTNATHHDHMVKQGFAIRMIFNENEIRKIASFFCEQKTLEATTVFFRAQLLELTQWIAVFCHDLPGDGETFENPKVRQAFGKAALIASDLWGQRNYDGKIDATRPIEPIGDSRRRSLGAARIGTDAASSGMDPMLAIARGRKMFIEHFRHIHPTVDDEFREASGLALDAFYGLLGILAIHYLVRSPEDGGVRTPNSGLFHQDHFTALSADLKDAYAKYAQFASQTPQELADALRDKLGDSNGLACIRRRPILRTDDGRCIVMDPVFFAEHAAVGPLFTIVGKKKTGQERRQCFADFGLAFERYAHSILRRMYPILAPPLVDRLTCPFLGTSAIGEPVEIADACLNDATEIVLMEIKGRWLRDEDAAAPEWEVYLTDLHDKFARAEQPGSPPMGAGQLAKNISLLASGEWTVDNQDVSVVQRIYPVLLVYDARLQAAGHTWYLAEEFRIALAPDQVFADQEMRKGRFRVAGLIVLSIDDLENLETSVEGFALIDLLRDYSNASPDRLCSFHNYLAVSKYSKKLYANRALAGSALEVLAVAKELMGGVSESST